MINNIVTLGIDPKKVTISSLALGQLFLWESEATRTKLVGIRTVNMHQEPMGVMLYEGTYLSGEVAVSILPEGTVVSVVAG